MDQKGIHLLNPESPQSPVYGPGYVFCLGPVVFGLPLAGVLVGQHDPRLGNDLDLVTQARIGRQSLAEQAFALAIAVDVGVIENIQAALQLAFNPCRQGFGGMQLRVIQQSHHPEYQRYIGQIAGGL